MKNKLITVFLLTVVSINLYSQNRSNENLFKGIVSIGLNASQIDGDGPYGYHHIGALGGIGVMIKTNKYLSVSFEMLYSMRGTTVRRNSQINPQQTFTSATNYIEIPLCINLHDKKLAMATFGLSPAVLVKHNLEYNEYDIFGRKTNTLAPACLSNEPSKFDLSAIVGFQFFVNNSIGIGARFSYSVIGIRPPCLGDTRAKSQYHNVLTLKASYIIAEKKRND